MTAPTKLARGHAFVIVIGGGYRGSVLDASVIRDSDDAYGVSRESLVCVTTIDSKNANWRKCWNWAKKDIKWASREMLNNDRLFDDGVDYNVDAKTRKAIKEHDGAWIVRLRV